MITLDARSLELQRLEVLSESTEGYDRGAKAAHYRRIASLREYVLVAQDEPRIEVYRRNGRCPVFVRNPDEIRNPAKRRTASSVISRPWP